jgi:uncharacterized radical SAM superfamily Fe-S cluster-containing enzyme
MSLYADYLVEKTNDKILEHGSSGFATYRFLDDGKTVYIVDIYVVGKFRKSGLAKEMADKIAVEAKKLGAVKMLGTVIPSNKNSTESLKVLIAYGMRLVSSGNDLIVFEKEL